MRFVVIGTGDGGCNIADEFAYYNQWCWDNRGFGILTGTKNDSDVFAINLADLFSLKHIPPSENHTIQIEAEDGFIGRGAGKINRDGADQARRNLDKIISTVEQNSDIFSADAIIIIGTAAGGTGSGSLSVITKAIKSHFNKPTFAMVVLPFANELTDSDTKINTATCLNSILPNPAEDYPGVGDAQFILDNQRFVRPTDPIGLNYNLINRRIANAFFELCAVGEEQDPKFIGRKLDANDQIRAIKGPCVIGDAAVELPEYYPTGFLKHPMSFKIRKNDRHNMDSKMEVERAHSLVRQTISNLSASVGYDDEGIVKFDSEFLVWLLCGPDSATTNELQGSIASRILNAAPKSRDRHAYYPNRRKDLHLTVLLSNLGQGQFLDTVKNYYENALDALKDTSSQQGRRSDAWNEVGKISEGLPKL